MNESRPRRARCSRRGGQESRKLVRELAHKLASVEGRTAGLATRADETDKHISEVEGRTAGLATRADEPDKHISEVEGKLDRFEADSQRHRPALALHLR